MNMDTREFIFYLNEWEKATGKKDIDFCREIGIHKNTLLNWKKGDSAPQAKHIKKICDLFEINEVDLAPLSFYTAKDNANKLYYRSQQLQRYARSKGLSEDFYKRITSAPYFLKEFPFSCVDSRFCRLECPNEYNEDSEYMAELNAIPMVKYEFMDDYGNIIMLAEADIDFLVTLQRKSEQVIQNEIYLERHRQEEQRIRKLIENIASWHLEDGKEMNVEKLFIYLTLTDVTGRTITSPIIWERFSEYCKTHNVTSKPFRQIMLESAEERHPPMSEEEKQAWREHGLAAGLTEEQMDELFRRQEERRQTTIRLEKVLYKPDDEGSDKYGQH